MKFERKIDAVKHWVRGFNAIPQDVIIKAVENRNDQGIEGYFFDEVELLATPQVRCDSCGHEFHIGEATENGECPIEDCGSSDVTMSYEIPMWGTMWTFDEYIDEQWAYQNADVLADCGFHVFNHDLIGVFIGIDGAGYDFYEAHWTPLYDARGLKWHNEDEEVR